MVRVRRVMSSNRAGQDDNIDIIKNTKNIQKGPGQVRRA